MPLASFRVFMAQFLREDPSLRSVRAVVGFADWAARSASRTCRATRNAAETALDLASWAAAVGTTTSWFAIQTTVQAADSLFRPGGRLIAVARNLAGRLGNFIGRANPPRGSAFLPLLFVTGASLWNSRDLGDFLVSVSQRDLKVKRMIH